MVESADLALLAQWRNRNLDSFFGAWPLAVSEQQNWYQRYLGSGRERLFIIEVMKPMDVKEKKSEGWFPVGTIGLCSVSAHNQSAEIARVLIADKDDRKKGYMGEALDVLTCFAFEELNLNRLWLETFLADKELIKFYQDAGFQVDGVKRQAVWKSGKFRDVAIMSLLKGEWNDEPIAKD